MILQYPQKDTSGCYCNETPTKILASTNFFFYQNVIYVITNKHLQQIKQKAKQNAKEEKTW